MQRHIFQNRMHFAADFKRIAADDDLSLKQDNEDALDMPENISFVPGNEKPSMFAAVFLGDYRGTAYTINGNEHKFDPRSALSRDILRKYLRALGPDAEVTLDFGGGTQDDYTMYGKQHPNNNMVMRDCALAAVFAIKFGFVGIEYKDVSKLTGDDVRAYYAANNGSLPPELKNLKMDIIVNDKVIVKNCTKTDALFARWKDLRDAVLECQLKDATPNSANAKKLEKVIEDDITRIEGLKPQGIRVR